MKIDFRVNKSASETFSEKDKNELFSLKDDADETTEDSYVRYAMKDGDERSEEESRQEYREEVEPLTEKQTETGDEGDFFLQLYRERHQDRSEEKQHLDSLQEALTKNAAKGRKTRFTGDTKQVVRTMLESIGAPLSERKARQYVRKAFEILDQAVAEGKTGDAMMDAVDAAYTEIRKVAEEAYIRQNMHYVELAHNEILDMLKYRRVSLSKDQADEVRAIYGSVAAYKTRARNIRGRTRTGWPSRWRGFRPPCRKTRTKPSIFAFCT